MISHDAHLYYVFFRTNVYKESFDNAVGNFSLSSMFLEYSILKLIIYMWNEQVKIWYHIEPFFFGYLDGLSDKKTLQLFFYYNLKPSISYAQTK